MAEIKNRLLYLKSEIDNFDDKTLNINRRFQAECCYLQLRKITELTAIGVLLAHYSYPEFRTKVLAKIYNADELFSALSSINQNAFPVPVRLKSDPPYKEWQNVIISMKTPDPKIRKIICSIYQACCDQLHAGRLRSIMKVRYKPYDQSYIKSSFAKLWGILNIHVINFPDDQVLLAYLDLKSDGNVFCHWLDQKTKLP